MSDAEEKTWRGCEPLETAWLTLCDYGMPGWDRADELKRLQWVQDTEYDKIDVQLAKAERVEISLKRDFLHRIHCGVFEGFGRDITSSLGAPVIKLPASVFDDSHEGFEIDWNRSAIKALGRHIIEIRVRPAKQSNELEVPTSGRKGGRPRKIDALMEACELAKLRSPDFCALQTKQALSIVEDILKTNPKTAESFGAGVKLETLRRAKKAVCERG